MSQEYDAFMSRLDGPFSSLWGTVVSGTVSLWVRLLVSYTYDELTQPKGSSLQLNLGDL